MTMLTEMQKQAVFRLRQQGLTYAGIAGALGLSPNTVKSICHRNNIPSTSAKAADTDVCKNCGSPLIQKHGVKKKSFCSDQCRYDWWNKYRHSQPYRLICKQCGETFVSLGNPKRLFCGRDCYNLSRQQKGVP